MSTPVVDVRDAFRIHRASGVTAVALQGLSLQVAEGEIVVVLGPSGSGKTTLLRTLAAFEPLSAGTARVLGTDVGELAPAAAASFRARRLGLLDQHYARALSPDLSCVHAVALGLELSGTPPRKARETAAELLARVGLGERLAARPGSLSGGEQQRVAVCAAICHRPQLLLADEPAGELDDANAAAVYLLVAELVRAAGASAIVVSHDEAAAGIADRLVHVHDGRVVEERAPGCEPALVVNEPGWIRLPDSVLAAVGGPHRVRATVRDGDVVLSPASGAASSKRTSPTSSGAAPAQRRVVAELRDVVKGFVADAVPVVDRVSFGFESSTFTAIVGRSGSGKTTLLHLLAGLEAPSSGEVWICGEEIAGLSRSEVARVRREHVEVVTQEPGLIPHLSALENVELGLAIRGRDDGTAAREALEDVGLGQRLAHRADRLSAGERQRVAIARAVAARPALLLADEPTARLDQRTAQAVADLLLRVARETGAAVVCATHDGDVLERADARLELGRWGGSQAVGHR